MVWIKPQTPRTPMYLVRTTAHSFLRSSMLLNPRYIRLFFLTAPLISVPVYLTRNMSNSPVRPRRSSSASTLERPPSREGNIVKFPVSTHRSYPFTPEDFARTDEEADDQFYSSPRYVTHIDNGAIAALERYFDRTLPGSKAQPNSSTRLRPRLLDVCTSWTSHYPESLKVSASGGDRNATVEIYGLGMNKDELGKNALFDSGGRLVWDLNEKPWVPAEQLGLASEPPTQPDKAPELEDWEKLDAITITVSLDYLTQPLQVLKSIREITKLYGKIHVVVSNRCFPTKAVRRWLHADEEQRLRMVAEDLSWAGWQSVEWEQIAPESTVDSTNEGGGQQATARGSLNSVMAMMGLLPGDGDPLWVVRGTNPD